MGEDSVPGYAYRVIKSIQTATIFKLMHQAVNVLLTASVCSMVFTYGDPVWSVLVDSVIIASTAATVLMQRRSTRLDRQLGQWQERQYVVNSMLEAMHRDMTVMEWMDGYMERVKAEAEQ